MGNSRRWREFITWWKQFGHYHFPTELNKLIDDKIEEICRNKDDR